MSGLIVVFGGAFNPVTTAHLSLAEQLTNQYDIEKILFLPVSDLYKKNELSPSFHRVNMLRLACSKNKKFEVSEVETNSNELLYTIDSLEIVKNQYPNNPIAFLMGSDNLKEIHTWKGFDTLMKSFLFIVIGRNGDDTEKIVSGSEHLKLYKERFIHFSETLRNDGNSSYIRNLIKEGKSVKYLITDEVYTYIIENNLYGIDKEKGKTVTRDLQKEIIEKLKVSPVIDPKSEIRRSIDFIKKYLIKNEYVESLVLGISGGQDSTLAGKLAQMAIDELNTEIKTNRYKFIAVRLPYGTQKDEEDCQDALRFINPSKVITINIKTAVDKSVIEIEKASGEKLSDFLKGNEKARERMKAQYSIAGMYKGLVLGTDHAAEAITGFFTKFGDGACDIAPIYRLNKRQGRLLLKELGCPEHLYLKAPTADLEDDKPQLPDEAALGLTYDIIDDYLEGKSIDEKSKRILEGIYIKTIHKRNLPVTVFDI